MSWSIMKFGFLVPHLIVPFSLMDVWALLLKKQVSFPFGAE